MDKYLQQQCQNVSLKKFMNNLSNIVLIYTKKYCKNNNLNVIRNVLVIIFRPNVLILINIFQKHFIGGGGGGL